MLLYPLCPCLIHAAFPTEPNTSLSRPWLTFPLFVRACDLAIVHKCQIFRNKVTRFSLSLDSSDYKLINMIQFGLRNDEWMYAWRTKCLDSLQGTRPRAEIVSQAFAQSSSLQPPPQTVQGQVVSFPVHLLVIKQRYLYCLCSARAHMPVGQGCAPMCSSASAVGGVGSLELELVTSSSELPDEGSGIELRSPAFNSWALSPFPVLICLWWTTWLVSYSLGE